MNHLILIGFMGSGKSTVGRELAKQLHREFIDTDEFIEMKERKKIKTIFEEFGEPFFRELETNVLSELSKKKEPLVIAAGGGLPIRKENRERMKKLGATIYLTAKIDTLENRLKDDTTRPILQGVDLRKKIQDLMTEREEIYQQAADIQIATDGKTGRQIAEEIKSYVSKNTESV